jgi:hypothetical protein
MLSILSILKISSSIDKTTCCSIAMKRCAVTRSVMDTCQIEPPDRTVICPGGSSKGMLNSQTEEYNISLVLFGLLCRLVQTPISTIPMFTLDT